MLTITSEVFRVISDWFSNISFEKFCIFCTSKNRKLYNTISQNHTSQKRHRLPVLYTNGHISKVGGVWTWFWHQTKAESVLLTIIRKHHFTQNVTCSVGVHHIYSYIYLNNLPASTNFFPKDPKLSSTIKKDFFFFFKSEVGVII